MIFTLSCKPFVALLMRVFECVVFFLGTARRMRSRIVVQPIEGARNLWIAVDPPSQCLDKVSSKLTGCILKPDAIEMFIFRIDPEKGKTMVR